MAPPSPGADSVKVVARIRPLLERERAEGCRVALDVCTDAGSSHSNVVTVQGLTHNNAFSFDRVLCDDVAPAVLHEEYVQPLVQAFLSGYNATIFAYGQTGAGKSFTMGTDQPATRPADATSWAPVSQHVFAQLEQLLDDTRSTAPAARVTLTCSFFEIYQDTIRDLLAVQPAVSGGSTAGSRLPSAGRQKARGISIRDPDPSREVILVGLEEVKVCNAAQLHQCLADGTRKRATASTNTNQHSSRSHALLVLHLQQELPGATPGAPPTCLSSKLYLVDLAGSERLRRSLAEGARLTEACSINTGLLALANVIEALSEPGRKHIPYRDHLLTHILRHALGGNSQTLMLACLSPADVDLVESLNTLRYAARARMVRNTPQRNQAADAASANAAAMAALRQDNEALRQQLETLLQQQQQWESQRSAPSVATTDSVAGSGVASGVYGSPDTDTGSAVCSSRCSSCGVEKAEVRSLEQQVAEASATAQQQRVQLAAMEEELHALQAELREARADLQAEQERSAELETRCNGLTVRLHHTLDLNSRLEQQLMEVKQLAAEQLAAAEAQVQADQQDPLQSLLDMGAAAGQQEQHGVRQLVDLYQRLLQQQQEEQQQQLLRARNTSPSNDTTTPASPVSPAPGFVQAAIAAAQASARTQAAASVGSSPATVPATVATPKHIEAAVSSEERPASAVSSEERLASEEGPAAASDFGASPGDSGSGASPEGGVAEAPQPAHADRAQEAEIAEGVQAGDGAEEAGVVALAAAAAVGSEVGAPRANVEVQAQGQGEAQPPLLPPLPQQTTQQQQQQQQQATQQQQQQARREQQQEQRYQGLRRALTHVLGSAISAGAHARNGAAGRLTSSGNSPLLGGPSRPLAGRLSLAGVPGAWHGAAWQGAGAGPVRAQDWGLQHTLSSVLLTKASLDRSAAAATSAVGGSASAGSSGALPPPRPSTSGPFGIMGFGPAAAAAASLMQAGLVRTVTSNMPQVPEGAVLQGMQGDACAPSDGYPAPGSPHGGVPDTDAAAAPMAGDAGAAWGAMWQEQAVAGGQAPQGRALLLHALEGVASDAPLAQRAAAAERVALLRSAESRREAAAAARKRLASLGLSLSSPVSHGNSATAASEQTGNAGAGVGMAVGAPASGVAVAGLVDVETWLIGATQDAEVELLIQAERAARSEAQHQLQQLAAQGAAEVQEDCGDEEEGRKAEGGSVVASAGADVGDAGQGEEVVAAAGMGLASDGSSDQIKTKAKAEAEATAGRKQARGARKARREDLERRCTTASARIGELLLLQQRCRVAADAQVAAIKRASSSSASAVSHSPAQLLPSCGSDGHLPAVSGGAVAALMVAAANLRRHELELQVQLLQAQQQVTAGQELVQLYLSEAEALAVRLQVTEQHAASLEASNTRLGVLAAQRQEAVTLMVASRLAQAEAEEQVRQLEDELESLQERIERQQQHQQQQQGGRAGVSGAKSAREGALGTLASIKTHAQGVAGGSVGESGKQGVEMSQRAWVEVDDFWSIPSTPINASFTSAAPSPAAFKAAGHAHAHNHGASGGSGVAGGSSHASPRDGVRAAAANAGRASLDERTSSAKAAAEPWAVRLGLSGGKARRGSLDQGAASAAAARAALLDGGGRHASAGGEGVATAASGGGGGGGGAAAAAAGGERGGSGSGAGDAGSAGSPAGAPESGWRSRMRRLSLPFTKTSSPS